MTDMYEMIPFLKIWKLFLPERLIQQFASLWPAGVVTDVKWDKKVQGLIISVPTLPEELFAKRENTLKAIKRIVRFIRKISHGNVYVGLGEWWPMATNNGLAFKRVLEENDKIVITNGQTATLLSIYLTVKKICKIARRDLSSIKIAIIGIGKMGTAVLERLNGKVAAIGLFDRNNIRLNIIEEKMNSRQSHSAVMKYVISNEQFDEENISALCSYDMAICTTSNIDFIVKDARLLKNIVIIDDSRPEAFPRIFDTEHKVLVLEGGLIKLKGIKVGVDFGFGKEDNVFGCLAETIILVLDKERKIRPTLGDIDFDNFEEMIKFCEQNNFGEGDLKSNQQIMNDEAIRKILA